MTTIMSGLGFQNVMTSMGAPTNVTATPARKISRGETIHSGHFMVSEIDESEQTVEQKSNEPSHESEYETPVETSDSFIPYDLDTECKETTHTYISSKSSNSVSIDGSLTKLFECMSLAYSGKITSPRWKTFKGLKLKLKDKIRLNNIIWRAWHIQYIAGRSPIVCQFSSPIDSDTHKKPEAVILEGKYWKRSLSNVTAEYQKWRLYYRRVGRPHTPSRPTSFDWENRLFNWSTNLNSLYESSDDYSMDFTDSLFSQLLQPNLIDFPNPREIARSGMGAEFMQPGLAQLQPNLDDFMDTFEPLQELLFNSKNMSSLPTLPEETNVENTNSSIDQQNSKLCQSIPEISAPDILNSLLCQNTTTTPNSITSLQSFSALNNTTGNNNNNINNNLNKSLDSIVQNVSQMNTEIELPFKNNTINTIQVIPSIQQIQEPIKMMPTINAVTAIPSKSLHESMYTQFGSTAIGAQRDVPLPQSQSPLHHKSRAPLVYDFAQTNSNNTSLSSLNISPVPQIYNTKSSPYKHKYITTVSPEANVEKFIVPKAMPIKQKSRERSISTPHINKDNISIPGFTLMPPQSAISLTDIHSRVNHNVERSSSLPVYTQERRRGVVSMPRNATISSSTSSANLSYAPQPQQMQHSINKLQMSGQTNIVSNSVPSLSSYSSPQFALPNAYNISQGSSSGSTLIARLLTSNSMNNISNDNSPQLYSNQSTAQTMNLSNNVSDRSTTIDATCIGIRNPVTTIANEKPSPYIFSADFREPNISSINQNLKQNFIIQPQNNITSQIQQMPSIVKSRSSPIGRSSPKESFVNLPSLSSPTSLCSPQKTKPKTAKDRIQYKEHRRVCHINAEQKRRCNIKNGFDTLRSLLPSVSQNTNTKISKAGMLQKAAEHIRALKSERQSQQEEYDSLKQQVESLNQTIGVFQNQLPETGVPISCQRSNQTRELYENYVRERTLQNWKFWIFSKVMESLWDSYNSTVATSNDDEMYKTLLRWLEQNCCLNRLRKDVLNSLRFLSTSTNILTNPNLLSDEAVLAVTKKEKPLSS